MRELNSPTDRQKRIFIWEIFKSSNNVITFFLNFWPYIHNPYTPAGM